RSILGMTSSVSRRLDSCHLKAPDGAAGSCEADYMRWEALLTKALLTQSIKKVVTGKAVSSRQANPSGGIVSLRSVSTKQTRPVANAGVASELGSTVRISLVAIISIAAESELVVKLTSRSFSFPSNHVV